MGTLYRRQVRYCTTCARRLDTRAALHACTTAGHIIEARDQPIWWIKYQVGGRPQCVSSHSEKKEDAKRLLKTREGDVVRGVPITADGRTPDPETSHALLRPPPADDDHHVGRPRLHGAASGGRGREWLDQSRPGPA